MAKRAKPFNKFERSIAMRYLGARRKQGGVGLIAWISFTCLALAIAALIIVMSIMNGFRYELVSRILGAQGHLYVATAADYPTALDVSKIADFIRAQDGVDVAFPVLNRQAFVAKDDRGSPAIVKGVTPQDLARLEFVLDGVQYGDFSQFGAGEYGGDIIGIGEIMASTLGVSVGDDVMLISPKPINTAFGSNIQRKSYTIGAIYSLGFDDADSLYVYMPLEQALLFFDQGEASDEIEVRLKDPDDVGRFVTMLRNNPDYALYVTDWRQRAKSIAGALRVEQVAMRFILMIVVVIAIFPIVAAMIMLVKNKGRDIAILRTIGATRGSVLRIFFMAGVLIGLAGTAAGIILGVLFCLNIGGVQAVIEAVLGVELFPPDVYQLTGGVPARIEWAEVGMVAFWGFLTTAVATFFPALGASKLDPVEAFRFE
ncbi:lipoprotein-releasing ABC transporter permease subunit [Robiginitomaculum antarcticum]|uniref:lipoprotein-releasing ABC transporter permease subunit n=1 Tax=Robiginitomaculum antarcticum TaxID=437507 RepID=UPI00036C2011|nr:lipoprotein-releasing ABC transporter permease subunit [Robiginitomaculum antarcticum]